LKVCICRASSDDVETLPSPTPVDAALHVHVCHACDSPAMTGSCHGTSHSPDSGNFIRQSSTSVVADPQHAANHAARTGDAFTFTLTTAAATGLDRQQKQKLQDDMAPPRSEHLRRRSQHQQVWEMQSLSLKGVALGQTVGIEVLRELVVCAPKLRRLDVGATQLSEGDSAAAVREALEALTQVTMLGLSGVDV
jgi:hypothetical protein